MSVAFKCDRCGEYSAGSSRNRPWNDPICWDPEEHSLETWVEVYIHSFRKPTGPTDLVVLREPDLCKPCSIAIILLMLNKYTGKTYAPEVT